MLVQPETTGPDVLAVRVRAQTDPPPPRRIALENMLAEVHMADLMGGDPLPMQPR
jgi:hypothetical protein